MTIDESDLSVLVACAETTDRLKRRWTTVWNLLHASMVVMFLTSAIFPFCLPIIILLSSVYEWTTNQFSFTCAVLVAPGILAGLFIDRVERYKSLLKNGDGRLRQVIECIVHHIPYVLLIRPHRFERGSEVNDPRAGIMTVDGVVGRDPDYHGHGRISIPADLSAVVKALMPHIPPQFRVFCLAHPSSDIHDSRLESVFVAKRAWTIAVRAMIRKASAIIALSPVEGKGLRYELDLVISFKLQDKTLVVLSNTDQHRLFVTQYELLSPNAILKHESEHIHRFFSAIAKTGR